MIHRHKFKCATGVGDITQNVCHVERNRLKTITQPGFAPNHQMNGKLIVNGIDPYARLQSISELTGLTFCFELLNDL